MPVSFPTLINPTMVEVAVLVTPVIQAVPTQLSLGPWAVATPGVPRNSASPSPAVVVINPAIVVILVIVRITDPPCVVGEIPAWVGLRGVSHLKCG